MVVIDVSFLRWWSSVQKATVQTGWSGDRPCFPCAFLLISWNKSKQTWLKALWEAADKDSSNSRWTKKWTFSDMTHLTIGEPTTAQEGQFPTCLFQILSFSPSLTIGLGFLTHWMQSCSWPQVSWRRVVTPLGGPPDSTNRSSWTFRALSVPVAGSGRWSWEPAIHIQIIQETPAEHEKGKPGIKFDQMDKQHIKQKKSHIFILHIILRTLNLPHFHRGSFSNDFMVSWGAPSDQLLVSTRKTRQTTCGADRCVAQWTARLAPVAAFGVGNHNHPWISMVMGDLLMLVTWS